MPVGVVNIVQSFIRELESDPLQQDLVKAMIALPQDLAYRVVAEGVENEAVLAFLREAGCDEAQGYWFARPLETAVFTGWYVSRHIERAQQLSLQGLRYRPTDHYGDRH